MVKKTKTKQNKTKKSEIVGLIFAIFFLCGVVAVGIILSKSREGSAEEVKTAPQTEEKPSEEYLLGQCINSAINKFPITESDMSATDNSQRIASLNKLVQLYDAKLQCYVDHAVPGKEPEIAKIQEDRAGVQDLIRTFSSTSGGTYTPPTTTQPSSGQSPYTPPVVETPSAGPTCDEYEETYYTQYVRESNSIRDRYYSLIREASMSSECSKSSNCWKVTNLEKQRDSEIAQARLNYIRNMHSHNCEPKH